MYGSLPLSGPGDGVFPPAVQHIKVRNGTLNVGGQNVAFAPGSVIMLDVSNASGLATSFVPGHATSGADDSIENVAILPTTAGIAAGYPIFVCEETVAVGAVGRATLMSPVVLAKVGVASGNIAQGAVLVPGNNTDVFVSSASATATNASATWIPAGAWALASSASTTATSASTVLASVWLNGRLLG